MRKPPFWKLSFWPLGAPLGSLRLLQTSPGPVLGPRWLPNDPQKWPKIGSKNGPKFSQILGCSWTYFGAHFGIQNGVLRGDHFSMFFWVAPGPLSGSILVSFWLLPGLSWASLGPNLAPLGLILASFWFHLGALGLSWRPLGLFLALSWLS